MIEKYTAGLMDSDGCIRLHFNKRKDGTFRAAASIKISQVHGDIKHIAEEFGLSVYTRTNQAGNTATDVYAFGQRAVNFLERIEKHLRVKRHLSNWIRENHGKVVNDPKPLKKEMKQVRQVSASLDKGRPPSRAWLAGYFDGDGCLTLNRRSRGSSEWTISISGWIHDKPILDTIKKQFGGRVFQHSQTNQCYEWRSYCKKKQVHPFVSYIVSHVRIKRHKVDQYLHMTRND